MSDIVDEYKKACWGNEESELQEEKERAEKLDGICKKHYLLNNDLTAQVIELKASVAEAEEIIDAARYDAECELDDNKDSENLKSYLCCLNRWLTKYREEMK